MERKCLCVLLQPASSRNRSLCLCQSESKHLHVHEWKQAVIENMEFGEPHPAGAVPPVGAGSAL